MQVRVLIQRSGRPAIAAGTIALANGALTCNPNDSELLQDILRQPLSLPIEGGLRDLHAETDPSLFLRSLHRVYAGPFLRVTPVEPDPVPENDLAREGLGPATPQAPPNGHNGAGHVIREVAPREQSPSASANRTDAWDHERLG